MAALILTLQGCSEKLVYKTVYKDRVVVMSDMLLISPCEGFVDKDIETVRHLAEGYVVNTSCLKQHMLLLKKQKEYKSSMEKVYGGQQ